MEATKQRALDLGAALRDEGIARAAGHAERVSHGWRDLAAVLLREFAKRHKTFMSEEFVAHSLSRGLPCPPDARAFGAVMTRGRRDGVIRHEGFAVSPNPKHHADVARVWRSKIFRP